MTRAQRPHNPRRPYQKPQIEHVALVADEVALANCKSPTIGGGKDRADCGYPTDACKHTYGS